MPDVIAEIVTLVTSNEKVYEGDTGTIFRLTITEDGVPVDVSGAVVKQIKFKNPAGTTITRAAAFTGTGVDGKIQYTTLAADLNEEGEWHWQGYVQLPAWTGHTEINVFEVEEPL